MDLLDGRSTHAHYIMSSDQHKKITFNIPSQPTQELNQGPPTKLPTILLLREWIQHYVQVLTVCLGQ